jgi:hypothetical protein
MEAAATAVLAHLKVAGANRYLIPAIAPAKPRGLTGKAAIAAQDEKAGERLAGEIDKRAHDCSDKWKMTELYHGR